MSKSLLVTYTHSLGYLGAQVEAMTLDSPEPFSPARLRLDIAQRMGEVDASSVLDVEIMAEGQDLMEQCQEKRSNPFSWTVEYFRYEEPQDRYCASLWAGDYIVARVFGTRAQCSAVSAHWWERIFEHRNVFATYRRNIVAAMRQDIEASEVKYTIEDSRRQDEITFGAHRVGE